MRSNCVFLDRLEAWRLRNSVEQLRVLGHELQYDINLGGWWIERGSKTYTLAILLGFNLQDPFKKTENNSIQF